MIARTRRAVRPRPAVHPLTFADDVRPWTFATVFVVGGYLLFQRPFAYLGVPGTPLFVGEMLLAAFYLLRSDVAGHRLMRALLTPDRLGAMAWGVFLVALYGATLVIRGDNADYPRRLMLQEFVFNLYPLYLFLGLWLAERQPKLLERFMIGVAWATGIYGAIYLPFLNNSIATIPGTPIQIGSVVPRSRTSRTHDAIVAGSKQIWLTMWVASGAFSNIALTVVSSLMKWWLSG